MSDERGSVPMPSPIPMRQPTGRHSALPPDEGDVYARAWLKELRARIGEPPDASGKKPAEGSLWYALGAMEERVTAQIGGVASKVDRLAVAVESDRKAREDERAAHEAAEKALARRAEPFSRLGWLIVAATVGPTMAAIVAGLIYLLTRSIK